MPAFESTWGTQGPSTENELRPAQFPAVTRDHILHCSYDQWFPRYRASCLKSRIIPLPSEFVNYLREDGITLADERVKGRGDEEEGAGNDGDGDDDDDDDDWEPSIPTGVFQQSAPGEAGEEDEDDEDGVDSDSSESDARRSSRRVPPNRRFPAVHERIKEVIEELGGQVVPKLNWSSPKDATWIMMDKNTMRCTTPNDVYLLLKSSSFISHDLEHAFDGCIGPRTASSGSGPGPEPGSGSGSGSGPGSGSGLSFTPVLVLRPYFKPQTALEFRCFVKHRNLVAISQRDPKHYPFLQSLRPAILARIEQLFHDVLRFTFPDGNFVFDVYIPEGDGETGAQRLSRARLIDINPWAGRTDSLLFDWEELLDLRVPRPVLGTPGEHDGQGMGNEGHDETSDVTDEEEEEDEADEYQPELRLVGEDDPINSNFLGSQYSAHKLPREVVDASMAGEVGLREFAEQWRQMVERSSGSRQ